MSKTFDLDSGKIRDHDEEALMVFQGEVQSIATMLQRAQVDSAQTSGSDVGLRHTAAGNAAAAASLLNAGDSIDAAWRFGVLQTFDDYTSTYRRGGVELAAEIFTLEPAPTGSPELDAAFAALADHLAERDGWDAPEWVTAPGRHAGCWFPAVPGIFRAEAERDSPRAFRQRGIFITGRSLSRA